MADGIRATVEFPPPPACPIAEISASIDAVVDDVWTSVTVGDRVGSVTEFVVEGERPPVESAAHVLSAGERHVFRLGHEGEQGCPCECLGGLGCAVQRYVARAGTLRLVFNAADYDELQSVIGTLRDRFPDVDVRRLVRRPATEAPRDEVFVDRGKLTDRQIEVLRTAHRMGYFERPRRANATEVAAELDIAASTFAEHLAAAESKLFEDVLEDVP